MIFDELRSDVQYITRDGIPGHESMISRVHGAREMPAPRDFGGDENCGSQQAEQSARPSADHDDAPQDLSAAIEEVKDVVSALAQEQVNLLLSGLEQFRDQLVAVIREQDSKKPRESLLSAVPSFEQSAKSESTADADPAGSSTAEALEYRPTEPPKLF